MIHWLKGLGFFGAALVIMVMGFALTILLPLISILATIIAIIVTAGWLGHQYIQYSKGKD